MESCDARLRSLALVAAKEDIEVVADASYVLAAVDTAAPFHPSVVSRTSACPKLGCLHAAQRILARPTTRRADLDSHYVRPIRLWSVESRGPTSPPTTTPQAVVLSH